ncbi:hypothetical protein [Saccharothrix algeriensis]|uniref:Uncharacterized protein n=1 Tax=Saccharothrix algeriensis TaxID=173560 RepID=A0A8T8HWG0_9PSEU|nr:hypothetical protein [Saccharothrix algeriensis]MBM7814173.1 hypothetical protein [Saccharothrix algeriensis]QTR02540.1 hypothetical protein J7S33_26105 [Saccharothrix algeriensis]
MTGLGSALTGIGLTVLVGLGVFAFACRLSAAEPLCPRDTRRIAAWRRATPWAASACAVSIVVGVGLLVAAPT